MTTLRDRVRSALGRTAPTDAEARTELDAILARTRPKRSYQVAMLVAAAALVLVAIRYYPRPPTADAGSHLYIHISGEPPESALAFDLTSSGAR